MRNITQYTNTQNIIWYYSSVASCVGVEPTTEATGGKCLFSRIFGRCVTEPVSVQQAATAISSLCTDDKYKGSPFSFFLTLIILCFSDISTEMCEIWERYAQQTSEHICDVLKLLCVTLCIGFITVFVNWAHVSKLTAFWSDTHVQCWVCHSVWYFWNSFLIQLKLNLAQKLAQGGYAPFQCPIW